MPELPSVERKGIEPKEAERQSRAAADIIKILSEKGFYGTLSFRFEAGRLIKCDSVSSLRLGDLEEIIKQHLG